MAYSNADLRVLTHTARIVAAYGENGAHPRGAEYTAQLADYRTRWQAFDDATKREIIDAVTEHIADLDGPRITAALAALEG
jgi:hypothetical protein